MPRPSATFEISGIEPLDLELYGLSARTAFWRQVVVVGLDVKDEELAAGKDRFGRRLRPIAPYTRKYRRSWTGHADPDAPPLIPAYAESRTRAMLAGRALRDRAQFFWRADPVTGKSWGRILSIHRAGVPKRNLPVRDVIGLSPASLARVQRQMAAWWTKYKKERAADEKRPKPGRIVIPKPKGLPKPVPKAKPTRVPQVAYYGLARPKRPSSKIKVYEEREPEPEPQPQAIAPAPKPAPRPKPKPKPVPKPQPVPAGPPVDVRGNVRPETLEAARDVLAGLSAKTQQDLARHGVKVLVGHGMADTAPDIVHLQPRGWKPGQTWANADGVYRVDKKQAVANETYQDDFGNPVTTGKRFRGVLRHELGHGVDAALGDVSKQAAFRAAYQQDTANLSVADRARFRYYLQAGDAGPNEAFAEIFAQLHGSGSSIYDALPVFSEVAKLILGLI